MDVHEMNQLFARERKKKSHVRFRIRDKMGVRHDETNIRYNALRGD